MSLKMTQDEREQFLAGLHVGVISVDEPGRGPLTVPIWYDYAPDAGVWLITGKDSRKGRLLQAVERFSLCAQSESMPYRYVSVEGPIARIEPSDREKHLRPMARRYLGDEQGDAYVEGSSEGDDSILVTMTPERWLTVDYGKLG